MRRPSEAHFNMELLHQHNAEIAANEPPVDADDTKPLPPIKTCANCGAQGRDFGTDYKGRVICCPHCVFNPCGCRCKRGEYGVPEEDCDY